MTGRWVACSEHESFDVDQKRLEQNYKRLQTVYHPDKYANTSRVHITLEFLSFPVLSHLSTGYPICPGKVDSAWDTSYASSGCIGGAGILSRGIIACQHSLQHPQSTIGQSHLSGDISHFARENCDSEGNLNSQMLTP